jgi:thymidylate synthase (FAD)
MKNTVELIGYYGGDSTHSLSAWTSTSRELNEDKINRIPKLLKMLHDSGHKTPFEKSSLHFLVNTDIASHIHLIKHRVGTSVNAESARYKELKEDKYYLPEDWQNIKITNFDSASLSDTWIERLEEYTQDGNRLYHQCLVDLEPVLGRKRAKETARFFKTYNSQIAADVMFNWSSFAHFLSLRMKPEAQIEIKEIAEQMLQLVRNIEGNPFEHTLAAFNY